MKILIGCLFFSNLTGSELYVYELAKGLKNSGFDVSVVSSVIGGQVTDDAKLLGINVYNFQTLPKNLKFDLIHCQHVPITNELIKLFPITKKICTIHSEVNQLENPVQHYSICKYIAIRPEIKNHMIQNFGISSDMIEIIYNPIDVTRFNCENTENKGYLLFVGTIDYLRKNTIIDLVQETKNNNQEFWIVGKNHSDYLQEVTSHKHVKYFESTPNIETFVKNCSVTAGILLGRTTIEGWMCGKPGWIYDVDNNGNIKGKKLFEVPIDIEKYKSTKVIEEIKKEYLKIV